MPARPSVSVFIATSLDGHIAAADGSVAFLTPYQQDPAEDYGYEAFASTVDCLVMGRTTYDTVLGFGVWPFAGKRVVVMTNRPGPSRHDETFAAGALGPVLEQLAADGVRHVYLDGGQLVRQGLREGVVDAMTITVIPVLLGAGRPLFGEEVPASSWHAESAHHFPSGPIQLRFRRA